MLHKWAAILSIHQFISVSKLLVLLWSLVELVDGVVLRGEFLGLVHLSSSVHKWLDFSILTLYNLSHCLVEEVLSCVPPTTALGS